MPRRAPRRGLFSCRDAVEHDTPHLAHPSAGCSMSLASGSCDGVRIASAQALVPDLPQVALAVTQLDQDLWLVVLEYLSRKEIMQYAMLDTAARRLTEHDALWVDAPEVLSASSVIGLKAAFVSNYRVRCMECRSLTDYVFPLLGSMRLCPSCEASATAPGGFRRFELCSKSDAKQIFLLDAADLRKMPSIQRSSPWATKCRELRLLLRSDVEECALRKFGGVDALQFERARRRAEDRETQGLERCEYEIKLPRGHRVDPVSSVAVEDSNTDADLEEKHESAEPTPPITAESGSGFDSWQLSCSAGSACENGEWSSDATCPQAGMPAQDGEADESEAGAADCRRRRRQGQRSGQRRAPLAPQEPLGLSIETAAPYTVRSVDVASLAGRQFGVQVGDRLLSVGGRSCATFRGGWPAIKAALSQRPIALRFQRTFHPYQRGALKPRRKGGQCKPMNLQPAQQGLPSRSRGRGNTGSMSRSSQNSAVLDAGDQVDGEELPKRQALGGAKVSQRPWLEVDYLSMGVSGLEVLD